MVIRLVWTGFRQVLSCDWLIETMGLILLADLANAQHFNEKMRQPFRCCAPFALCPDTFPACTRPPTFGKGNSSLRPSGGLRSKSGSGSQTSGGKLIYMDFKLLPLIHYSFHQAGGMSPATPMFHSTSSCSTIGRKRFNRFNRILFRIFYNSAYFASSIT